MASGGGGGHGDGPKLDSVWVENKAGEGKVYYYNAKTRETSWNRPEGLNVQIISQEQLAAGFVGLAQQKPQTSVAGKSYMIFARHNIN